jgi:hypothetical protein
MSRINVPQQLATPPGQEDWSSKTFVNFKKFRQKKGDSQALKYTDELFY